MTKVELVDYSQKLRYDDGELLESWVEGVVENVSGDELPYVIVVVRFVNIPEGQKLGEGSAQINNFEPEEQFEFNVPFGGTEPVDAEIYALAPDKFVSLPHRPE